MEKLNLSSCTLVTVSSVHICDTLDALLYNLRHINFAAVKFISHEKPADLPSQVEFCRCDKIKNLEDYSRFMIYNLTDYITTPYCLTIHRDGFIVNPNKWQNEFLQYDYIGAPWPVDEAFRSPKDEMIRVGNGGFSLRSKRLLECGRKAEIPFVSHNGCCHEDVLICVTHREQYEREGIRFAPIDMARYFAHEMRIPEIKGIKPFGFHKYRKQNRRYPKFPSRIKKWQKKLKKHFPEISY